MCVVNTHCVPGYFRQLWSQWMNRQHKHNKWVWKIWFCLRSHQSWGNRCLCFKLSSPVINLIARHFLPTHLWLPSPSNQSPVKANFKIPQSSQPVLLQLVGRPQEEYFFFFFFKRNAGSLITSWLQRWFSFVRIQNRQVLGRPLGPGCPGSSLGHRHKR